MHRGGGIPLLREVELHGSGAPPPPTSRRTDRSLDASQPDRRGHAAAAGKRPDY